MLERYRVIGTLGMRPRVLSGITLSFKRNNDVSMQLASETRTGIGRSGGCVPTFWQRMPTISNPVKTPQAAPFMSPRNRSAKPTDRMAATGVELRPTNGKSSSQERSILSKIEYWRSSFRDRRCRRAVALGLLIGCGLVSGLVFGLAIRCPLPVAGGLAAVLGVAVMTTAPTAPMVLNPGPQKSVSKRRSRRDVDSKYPGVLLGEIIESSSGQGYWVVRGFAHGQPVLEYSRQLPPQELLRTWRDLDQAEQLASHLFDL
jgi:hypothetical protein